MRISYLSYPSCRCYTEFTTWSLFTLGRQHMLTLKHCYNEIMHVKSPWGFQRTRIEHEYICSHRFQHFHNTSVRLGQLITPYAWLNLHQFRYFCKPSHAHCTVSFSESQKEVSTCIAFDWQKNNTGEVWLQLETPFREQLRILLPQLGPLLWQLEQVPLSSREGINRWDLKHLEINTSWLIKVALSTPVSFKFAPTKKAPAKRFANAHIDLLIRYFFNFKWCFWPESWSCRLGTSGRLSLQRTSWIKIPLSSQAQSHGLCSICVILKLHSALKLSMAKVLWTSVLNKSTQAESHKLRKQMLNVQKAAQLRKLPSEFILDLDFQDIDVVEKASPWKALPVRPFFAFRYYRHLLFSSPFKHLGFNCKKWSSCKALLGPRFSARKKISSALCLNQIS